MTTSTPLKWHQFRLRSLLAAALIVQLACVFSPHLVRLYEQYESRRRIRATVEILKADLANVLVMMPEPGKPSYAWSTFKYVEGPIGPVQTADGEESSSNDPSIP